MKISKYLVVGIFFILILSCSTEPPVLPAFRVANNGVNTVWVSLGTYDSILNSATPITEWVMVEPNEISAILYFPAGTYYVCYDWNSDHSGISTPIKESVYSVNQIYTITFKADNTLSILEE